MINIGWLTKHRNHTTITPAMARKLAVAYDAYTDALRLRDSNGVRVWGTMLLGVQASCGMDLVNVDRTKKNIEYHAGGPA